MHIFNHQKRPSAPAEFCFGWKHPMFRAKQTRTTKKAKSRLHPFCADTDTLKHILGLDGASRSITLRLPAVKNIPLPSPQLIHNWILDTKKPELSSFLVNGIWLRLEQAILSPMAFSAPQPDPTVSFAPAADLRYWSMVSALALETLAAHKLVPVLVNDEKGYSARWLPVLDKVGVAMATSGPGATNLVTGIACAMMDSSPIVCVTGQVHAHLIGGDAFQETDVTGITLPITKHNYLVTRADEIAEVVREAFYIARSGRPGPVLIDICKNAQIEPTEFGYPEEISLPGYCPPMHGRKADMQKAVEMIEKAKRPLILAGQGVLKSEAMDELMIFATKTHTPVALTLLGLSSFPASHPLSLGRMGMHGEASCNLAIQNADLLLAFGMRFHDRVTGNLRTYAPNAQKIHVEIDPSEVHKNVHVDVPLVGKLKTVLQDIM